MVVGGLFFFVFFAISLLENLVRLHHSFKSVSGLQGFTSFDGKLCSDVQVLKGVPSLPGNENNICPIRCWSFFFFQVPWCLWHHLEIGSDRIISTNSFQWSSSWSNMMVEYPKFYLPRMTMISMHLQKMTWNWYGCVWKHVHWSSFSRTDLDWRWTPLRLTHNISWLYIRSTILRPCKKVC